MIDVVITTNSPGELQSWVKGTVAALRARNRQVRIVLALVPCPYASGMEATVANQVSGLDIVLSPGQTVRLMLGMSVEAYKPSSQGVSVYLGGDTWHAWWLAKRLGYKTVAYCNRPGRLVRRFSRIGCSDTLVYQALLARGCKQAKLIGNLAVDGLASMVQKEINKDAARTKFTIGIFPGSRVIHLRAALGVFLRVAQIIHQQAPEIEYLLAVSPFVNPDRLCKALFNPLDVGVETAEGQLQGDSIVVEPGLVIPLVWGEPYKVMALAKAALAIPGTNTGELACCGIPTVVGLSSSVPFPRGGLGGMLDALPGVEAIKRYLRTRAYRRHRFAAQPNRLAGYQLVPEVVVEHDASVLAAPLLDWYQDEPARQQLAQKLRTVMGESCGAYSSLADLILECM